MIRLTNRKAKIDQISNRRTLKGTNVYKPTLNWVQLESTTLTRKLKNYDKIKNANTLYRTVAVLFTSKTKGKKSVTITFGDDFVHYGFDVLDL